MTDSTQDEPGDDLAKLQRQPRAFAAWQAAHRQKFVFAPTDHDVTQPVYRRALRRWEHYAAALAPLQSALAPCCRAVGYADHKGTSAKLDSNAHGLTVRDMRASSLSAASSRS